MTAGRPVLGRKAYIIGRWELQMKRDQIYNYAVLLRVRDVQGNANAMGPRDGWHACCHVMQLIEDAGHEYLFPGRARSKGGEIAPSTSP